MVKTKIMKVSSKKPEAETIKAAATVIKGGGLVVYPTETCYGLGADATNPQAVKKIFRVKKRPFGKPISIIVADLEMMKKYGEITEEIDFLVHRFMPGPLTIITHKKRTVPRILNPNEIAFRIPGHPVALNLVKSAETPITATSANISGTDPIYKINDIVKVFSGKVEMILDCDDLERKKPSTIIDLKDAKNPKVLREGPIPSEKILRELEKFISEDRK